MGYGEYGGGGSVHWRVVHRNGRSKSEKAKGRDAGPELAPGNEFTVAIKQADNTYTQQKVKISDNDERQILVIWPPDTLESILEDAEE